MPGAIPALFFMYGSPTAISNKRKLLLLPVSCMKGYKNL